MPQPAIGTTVTLSVETPVGPIGVVGVLVAATTAQWSVRRRDGSIIDVDVVKITAGRVVPPSRAERASVADVQRAAALGWRAHEVEPLGDWLLRAGGGFTGRANSALTLGDPGLPLAEAVEIVSSWYAERGLAPRIQLPDGAAPAALAPLLDGLGWESSPGVHVMTAEIGQVLRATSAAVPAKLQVRLDPTPDESWLASYRQDGGALPPAAREILVNHPSAIFASVRDADRAVAIARVAVDGRWAGLFAVEVAAEHRGKGLGTMISAASLRWAGEQGARRTYLQVAVDNTGAVRLYERLNFQVHHDYRYRFPPPPP
jgi:N-acetylglutamate synthase